MKEQWKQIIYRGDILPYEVSTKGRVRRIPGPDNCGRVWPQMIMKQHIHPSGYRQLCLRWFSGDKRKHKIICTHQLVAFAFLPPPPGIYGRGKIAINHKNCIKTDNRITNLEWATYQQNSSHAVINGRMKRGEENPNSVFTDKQVLEIRKRFAAGESMRSLARFFKRSRCPIKMICYRETWTHI